MVHEELSLGYGYWRGDGAQGLRAGSSRNKKKTVEPPTKKFRQNKVCSYFPFAITGAYDAKALVMLHDLQFCF